MERLSSREEVRRALMAVRLGGETVGFVPTMGALHEGHLSLVRASCTRTDVTVVSIFVNPTQFAPDEDLDAYPRDLERDLALLEAEGVDYVFTPTTAEMYPVGSTVAVDPGAVAVRWEGESRPHHFGGVATVVTKLFNIVGPDAAFFGEKDFQQLKVIERITDELDMSVTIVGCPIVRENDGVAMSSRNVYLSAEEREQARALSGAIDAAREAASSGERDVAVLEATMAEQLDRPLVSTEYAVIVDAETLEPLTFVDRPARALVAAQVGKVRLIDNAAITLVSETEG